MVLPLVFLFIIIIIWKSFSFLHKISYFLCCELRRNERKFHLWKSFLDYSKLDSREWNGNKKTFILPRMNSSKNFACTDKVREYKWALNLWGNFYFKKNFQIQSFTNSEILVPTIHVQHNMYHMNYVLCVTKVKSLMRFCTQKINSMVITSNNTKKHSMNFYVMQQKCGDWIWIS